MSALLNGSVSPEATPALPLDMLGARTTAFIDQVRAELRASIAAERAGRAEYERLVAESRAREQQMVKALNGLEGTRPEPKPQPKRPGTRVPSPRRHNWQPTPKKLAEVWRVVLGYGLEHPDGFSIGAVADATPGLSPEATRKCVEVFRAHELVRPAGKVRGGGIKWKLQPGADVEDITGRLELTAGGEGTDGT